MRDSHVESSFASIGELASAFSAHGCTELLVKHLAAHQDNEKNQIYLGKNLALSSFLPGEVELRLPSKSSAKRRSQAGEPIVGLKLDFYWLWPGEAPCWAPNASVIEYAQYPEVRFSGFLSQCKHAPDALRRHRQTLYGERFLVLGVSDDKVFGAVLSGAMDRQTVHALSGLKPWVLEPLMHHLPLSTALETDAINPSRLLQELAELAGQPHTPQILRREGANPEPTPGGNQAGGWTLEALLGIPRNAKSEPDKYGFELKAVGGSRTSLITTEPDFGFRAENGVAAYLSRFGRPAKSGNGKLVFSGIHRCGTPNDSSRAELTIENWDFEQGRPNGNGQPNIVLLSTETDEVISGWSFAKIGASWAKKHAGAVYVETHQVKGLDGSVAAYKYGPTALVGLGTSPMRFLTSVSEGTIFLDPGDSMALGASPHARTQWRIDGRIDTLLPSRLEPLYGSLGVHSLTS